MTKILGLLLIIGVAYLSGNCAEEELNYDKIYPGPRNSFRLETAEYPGANSANAEVVIKGKTSVTYLKPDTKYAQKLVTYFVADKNGFRARYNFSEVEYPPDSHRIGIGGLKAAAG